jgi:hypothetical protein
LSTLTVQISGGDLSQVEDVSATLTASDGQSTSVGGTIVGSTIEFANAAAYSWPPGMIVVTVDLSYYAYQLLDCQIGAGANASCSFTSQALSITTIFTVPLVCTPVDFVCPF